METRTAQRKLSEAQFFLGHLRREEGQATRQEPEAFRFYLSALLSAAISVVYALSHENGEAFDKWLSRWKKALPPKDARLWKRMWEQRGAEVHETGASVVSGWRAIPPEYLERFAVVIPLHLPTLATGTWVKVDEHHFAIGQERLRAVEFCSWFLGLLDRLLSEVPKS